MSIAAAPIERRPPTEDGFFNGAFSVLQPDNGDHRAGMDALLLSACVAAGFSGRLADFGAGTGVAGMAAASRNFAIDVDLVEINGELVKLVERSLRLPVNRKLNARVKTIAADITLSGRGREDGGLKNTVYDMVIMNPPFNDLSHRPSPIKTRQEAHMMGEGGLDSWLRSAAATLKGSGDLALIYRPSGIGQILAAFQGRFGSARIIPVHPKENEAANRILVLAKKGARGGISILPGFVVHQKDGSFTHQAADIFSGDALLPHLANNKD